MRKCDYKKVDKNIYHLYNDSVYFVQICVDGRRYARKYDNEADARRFRDEVISMRKGKNTLGHEHFSKSAALFNRIDFASGLPQPRVRNIRGTG